MIRAVLDADVRICALLKPAGVPGRLLRPFLEDAAFELVLTPGIAAVTVRALAYPKIRRRLPPGFVPADRVEDLAVLAVVVEDGTIPGVCRDPEDDRYLAAAAAGGAGYLMTGDEDLLALREFEGVLVLPPRRFLERLAGGEGRP